LRLLQIVASGIEIGAIVLGLTAFNLIKYAQRLKVDARMAI
jgi:hypothetical protein